jgi:basic membrane protein A
VTTCRTWPRSRAAASTSSSRPASCSPTRPSRFAQQFPNTKFAITDYSGGELQVEPDEHRGSDVRDAAEQLPDRLPRGARRGSEGKKNISVVGGLKIPPVDTFLAGYKAGAQKCVPAPTVQIGYSQDFIDQAKCKSVAQNQIDAGSQVVFGVAGPCGLGALDAAKEPAAGASASTSTSRTSALHPHERGEEGGHRHLPRRQGREERQGLQGRQDLVFNLKNGGVASARSARRPSSKKAGSRRSPAEEQIIAGKIKPPTDGRVTPVTRFDRAGLRARSVV